MKKNDQRKNSCSCQSLGREKQNKDCYSNSVKLHKTQHDFFLAVNVHGPDDMQIIACWQKDWWCPVHRQLFFLVKRGIRISWCLPTNIYNVSYTSYPNLYRPIYLDRSPLTENKMDSENGSTQWKVGSTWMDGQAHDRWWWVKRATAVYMHYLSIDIVHLL